MSRLFTLLLMHCEVQYQTTQSRCRDYALTRHLTVQDMLLDGVQHAEQVSVQLKLTSFPRL